MSTSESVVDVTARNIDHLITGASCRCLMCNKIQPTETQFETFTSMSRNGMVEMSTFLSIALIRNQMSTSSDPRSRIRDWVTSRCVVLSSCCAYGVRATNGAHPVSYLLPRRVRSFLKSMQMKCLRVIIMRSFAWH